MWPPGHEHARLIIGPNQFFLFYFNCAATKCDRQQFHYFRIRRCTTRPREIVPRRHNETLKITCGVDKPVIVAEPRASPELQAPQLVLFLMFCTNCGNEDGYSKRGKSHSRLVSETKCESAWFSRGQAWPSRLGRRVSQPEFPEYFSLIIIIFMLSTSYFTKSSLDGFVLCSDTIGFPRISF